MVSGITKSNRINFKNVQVILARALSKKHPGIQLKKEGSICGHFFHQICLTNWLKIAPKCPICNRSVKVIIPLLNRITPVAKRWLKNSGIAISTAAGGIIGGTIGARVGGLIRTILIEKINAPAGAIIGNAIVKILDNTGAGLGAFLAFLAIKNLFERV